VNWGKKSAILGVGWEGGIDGKDYCVWDDECRGGWSMLS